MTCPHTGAAEATTLKGGKAMSIEMLLIVLLVGFCLGLMVGVSLARPNIIS